MNNIIQEPDTTFWKIASHCLALGGTAMFGGFILLENIWNKISNLFSSTKIDIDKPMTPMVHMDNGQQIMVETEVEQLIYSPPRNL